MPVPLPTPAPTISPQPTTATPSAEPTTAAPSAAPTTAAPSTAAPTGLPTSAPSVPQYLSEGTGDDVAIGPSAASAVTTTLAAGASLSLVGILILAALIKVKREVERKFELAAFGFRPSYRWYKFAEDPNLGRFDTRQWFDYAGDVDDESLDGSNHSTLDGSGERRAGVLPVLALPFVAALGAKGDDEAPRRFSWLDFASRKKSDDADFASSDDADAARRKRADDAAP